MVLPLIVIHTNELKASAAGFRMHGAAIGKGLKEAKASRRVLPHTCAWVVLDPELLSHQE
jgi:hypothetical protein